MEFVRRELWVTEEWSFGRAPFALNGETAAPLTFKLYLPSCINVSIFTTGNWERNDCKY